MYSAALLLSNRKGSAMYRYTLKTEFGTVLTLKQQQRFDSVVAQHLHRDSARFPPLTTAAFDLGEAGIGFVHSTMTGFEDPGVVGSPQDTLVM